METQQLTLEPRPIPIWQSIREAIRGSHQDFTTGSLNRAILLLAIPMVLEMVLESLFAVVDVFWVGRLGADAVATVGLTESLLSLVFAVGLGLSLSTTAMVARRIGEKDPEGAAVAGVQAIAIGLAVSILVGVPCFFFAPELLRLMGASPQIIATGSGYTRIALGGSGAIMLLFLNNAIFRGAGDAAIAMRLLWVSNIINLILDPCLIFGWGPFPKLGRHRRGPRYLYRSQHRRPVPVLPPPPRQRAYPHLAQPDSPESQRLAALAARFADRHPAVRHCPHQLDRPRPHRQHLRFGRARRLHHRHPHRDLHPAAVLGTQQRRRHARRPKPRRQATRTRRKIRLAHRLLQHALPWRHRRHLHDFRHARRPPVHQRPASHAAGGILPAHHQLRQHRYAYGMVMLQAFNGAGDTITPTIVNLFGFWFIEIPLAYALAIPAHLHSNGVFISIVVAEAAIAAAGIILFRRGRWKLQQI